MPLGLLPLILELLLLLLAVLLTVFSLLVSHVFMLPIPHILNITGLFVQKTICLMIKFYGYVYHVSIGGSCYVVKVNYLDVFMAIMHGCGSVIVSDFVKTKVTFDNVHQWYKAL